MSKIAYTAWLSLMALGACSSAGTAASPSKIARTRFELCADAASAAPAGRTRLRAAQQTLRQSPDAPGALLAVGLRWVETARSSGDASLYANAGACADEALARNPREAAAVNLRALVWLNDHRFAEVKRLCFDALAGDPDDPMLWGTLSDAELELGEVASAIDAAQRMMDLKPNLPAYGRAAHLRWLQGDVLAAKRIYREAIQAGQAYADREPAAWMIVQAALVFWNEGDYAGADAGFDAALARVPDYAPALEGKGRVALSRGDSRAAAGLLERALARQVSAERLWLLGDAYALAGDRRRAEATYARLIEHGRWHDPRTLALFFATKGRDREEAVSLARADYARRKDLYSKDALAFALYRSGELAEAERLSREALSLGTPDARLLFHAGMIRVAAGSVEEGRALIRRALALNPHFDRRLIAQEKPT